jgi:tRNA pseudouridine13 synthase
MGRILIRKCFRGLADVPETTGQVWLDSWRFVSAEVAPIALLLKERHEDFVVTEKLSFEPSGEGEHLFLFVETRGRSTVDVARRLSSVFEVEARDVGFAGRKDVRALTRQWFSIRGGVWREGLEFEAEGLRVLQHSRNDRKLRLGALRGNRFELLLRGIAKEDRPRAEAVLKGLQVSGLPNFFGPQRFGIAGRSHELGRCLLEGRERKFLLDWLGPVHSPPSPHLDELRAVIEEGKRPGQRQLVHLAPKLPSELANLARQLARRPGDWGSALRALDRAWLGFQLSAWQAQVFNRVLGQRFDEWTAPQRGDQLQIVGSGSLFEVTAAEDLALLQRRVLSNELSLTGPLPGTSAGYAGGEPGRLERSAVEFCGVDPDALEPCVRGLSLPGTRRPLRVPVGDLVWSWSEEGLELKFGLPPGSYATTLVAELSKNPGLRPDSAPGTPPNAADLP